MPCSTKKKWVISGGGVGEFSLPREVDSRNVTRDALGPASPSSVGPKGGLRLRTLLLFQFDALSSFSPVVPLPTPTSVCAAARSPVSTFGESACDDASRFRFLVVCVSAAIAKICKASLSLCMPALMTKLRGSFKASFSLLWTLSFAAESVVDVDIFRVFEAER